MLLLLALLSFAWPSVLAWQGSPSSGTFQSPGIAVRPKFRYWLPDASVPIHSVQRDVSDFAAVGAGGLEFLPFYFYGLHAQGVEPPTDWNKYGFGTPASNAVFKGALQAANSSNSLMDFAFGANQGQGVPARAGTLGLAKQLVLGNSSVAAGQTFDGELAPGIINEWIQSGGGFQHPLEDFGAKNLTLVIAAEVESVSNETMNIAGSPSPVTKVRLNESSIIDLTSMVRDNKLKWTAPNSGKIWRILAVWEAFTNQKSCTGGVNATSVIGNGSWIVDHFSKDGAALMTGFFDQVVLADTETRALVAKVGRYAWEDSLEAQAALFWTPDLLERFECTYNYSLLYYLPTLFEATNGWGQRTNPYSEVFVYGDYTNDGANVHGINYRRVLNKGYHEYLKALVDYSHSIGVEYSSQVGAAIPTDTLSNVPFVDCPETESLGANDNIDIYRQFSGPAHLTGRKVISSELGAVRSVAFNMTIPDLLTHIKKSFAGGLNMMVMHGAQYTGEYPKTTWPGVSSMGYLFTEQWSRRLPSWRHFSDVMNYIARNQYILQQGEPNVDLVFYLNEIPSLSMTSYQSTNLQRLGYTYDYLDGANLQLHEANVANGTLASSGPAYKALIIANSTQPTLATADRIRQLAHAGLPVFLVGPAAHLDIVDGAENSLGVNLGSFLSGIKNVKSVVDAKELPNSLATAGIYPRTALDNQESWYVARRNDVVNGIDYIYIYNDGEANSSTVTFETSASAVPYVLDTWTGSEARVVQYTQTSSNIVMPIELQAGETVIVALKYSKDLRPSLSVTEARGNVTSFITTESNVTSVQRQGPATIKAASGKAWSFTSSPPQPVQLATWDLTLEDWHGSKNVTSTDVETRITVHNISGVTLQPWKDLGKGLEAVSGVGHYRTNFTAPVLKVKGSADSLGAILSLGPIFDTVRVLVNGEMMTPIDPVKPTVDITDAIHWGSTNDLQIDVTSTLFNRIKAQGNTTLSVGHPVAYTNPKYESSDFLPYGLVGPVEVRWVLVDKLA